MSLTGAKISSAEIKIDLKLFQASKTLSQLTTGN